MCKSFFLIILVCTSALVVKANDVDTLKKKIDITRIRYHENIEKQQKLALEYNNGDGALLNVSRNHDINAFVTDAIVNQVNILKDSIESATYLDHRLKVKYLSGLENLLKGFNNGWRNKTFNPVWGEALVSNYKALLKADIKKEDITPIVSKASYEVGNININGEGTALYENGGINESRNILFRKFCEKILIGNTNIEQYYSVPFADSLVKAAAHLTNQLYNYAAATRTNVGHLIRKNDDSLVKAIVAIANSKSGQQYFPFLDEIVHERLTLQDVFDVMGDNVQYYRLLVKVQTGYMDRLTKRDTPLAYR